MGWIENIDGSNFIDHIVVPNRDHANNVYTEDMDSDGDDEKGQLKMTARSGARAPLPLSRLTYARERQEITYTNPYDHTDCTERITPHVLRGEWRECNRENEIFG